MQIPTQALKASMKDPAHAVDPTQTHEYQKLFTVASKHADVSLSKPFMLAAWKPSIQTIFNVLWSPKRSLVSAAALMCG